MDNLNKNVFDSIDWLLYHFKHILDEITIILILLKKYFY